MKENKMIQKSGDNSNQYQIENYYEGIPSTELQTIIKEVRNIISEENKLLLDNMRIVASETAQQRLNNYTEVLIPRLVKAELLTAFSEPHIQLLFKESEKTAICTDRKTDYEMLSELLVHKINKNEDYTISAAIAKAISEVNNISEQAMMCLTLLFAITTYSPKSGNIKEGLSTLNNLYGHILEHFDLPDNRNWIDNLEIVNALRISTIGNSKKIDDFWFETLEGYSLLGIKKDSDKYNETITKLTEAGLPTEILTENVLDSDYVRLEIPSEDTIEELYLTNMVDGNIVKTKLSDSQRQVLHDIYKGYNQQTNKNKEKFKNALNEFDNIKIIIEWWNNNIIHFSFQITAIGRVLACTNAIRIDSSLPNVIFK